MSTDLPKLPEPHLLGSETEDGLHHYTTDQMRAYAQEYAAAAVAAERAAERERCAELCESLSAAVSDEQLGMSQFQWATNACAAAIRGQDQKGQG